MRLLTIIRGVSGSGKSTLARSMLTPNTVWYEADMFFNRPDGSYEFDFNKLTHAHKWCQNRVIEAMEYGREHIIVSNTFTRKWEIDPYTKLAKQHGYMVQLITVDGNFGNTHNVPDEAVQKMRDRWEHITLEDLL